MSSPSNEFELSLVTHAGAKGHITMGAGVAIATAVGPAMFLTAAGVKQLLCDLKDSNGSGLASKPSTSS